MTNHKSYTLPKGWIIDECCVSKSRGVAIQFISNRLQILFFIVEVACIACSIRSEVLYLTDQYLHFHVVLRCYAVPRGKCERSFQSSYLSTAG